MLNWARSRPKTFVSILLFGVVLRLVFMLEFPVVQGDTEMYAEIARTWLQSGTYGVDEGDGPVPTHVRLPGYPAFLAVIFALGGDHPGMLPAMYVQLLFDLLTCLMVAGITLELFGDRAAWTSFLLAAVCPFTSNYVALPLTETLSIFATAWAMWLAVRGVRRWEDTSMRLWMGCGAAIGCATLLRPDGMLLLIALGAYFFGRALRSATRGPALRAGFIVALVAVLPLLPWTYRNWRVFHEFQPLAPRYTNAPGEFVPHGYNRWVRTWIADYVSVEDFFWKMPGDGVGESVDSAKLPGRAFDSPAQRAQTLALLADFNQRLRVDPILDARFGTLARERIEQAPLRYYVWLPGLRIADMWLRPRTEMLPLEVRWWEFDDVAESSIAIAYGGLNLFFVVAAAVAAWRWRATTGIGLLLIVIVVRTLFLGSLENPEPRYTLEAYPIVLVLASATIAACTERKKRTP